MFLILVTVRFYTVMLEVCRWLTNEKQRKTDICVTDQPAIAAMHGPHSVFDIGHCAVIHCDGGGRSLVDQ